MSTNAPEPADPGPGPDELAADRIDGAALPQSLAFAVEIMKRLPPEVADAVAAEYQRATELRLLHPEQAQRYRPSIAALAKSSGIPETTLRRAVHAAVRAFDAERRGLRVGVPTRGTPRSRYCDDRAGIDPATNGARQCARVTRGGVSSVWTKRKIRVDKP